MSEYIINDERDYEIINGKTYMMSRPNMDHVTIAGNIHEIFKRFLKGKMCRVYIEPDVFLDDKNNFIPDIAVLCDKSKKKSKGIYGAPDLIAEILSPSTDARDLGEKRDVYGKMGVKEYWIVDPQSKKITVCYLSCDTLNVNNVYYYRSAKELEEMPEDDKKAIIPHFKTKLFNDLDIDLSEVFEDIE